MSYDNNERRQESVYSQRIKAGKKRTYFFDVRETRNKDYYLTITESIKRFDNDGYERHKLLVYKEDFNKFMKALNETVEHIKTELMPDFDFDSFNHEYPEGGEFAEKTDVAEVTAAVVDVAIPEEVIAPKVEATASENPVSEEVDKW